MRGRLLLLALAPSACRHGDEAATTPPAVERHGLQLVVPPASPLRGRIGVDTAVVTSVARELIAPSVVEADPARMARIVPPATGRVLKVHVHFGDVVAAGQPLLTLNAPDFSQAISDFHRAQSAVDLARRNNERQIDLQRAGVASVRDVEQTAADLAQATSELERARSRLVAMGADPNQPGTGVLEVRSPVAGVVDDIAIAEGEFRNDASAPLMTVADLSRVFVTANVQEKDIGRVAKGQPAEARFAAYPDRPRSGVVFSVGDLLDPDTRTIKVRVALDNPGQLLKPGMFATLRIAGGTAPSVVVPTSAVVQLRDTTCVYVEVAPWTFEIRPVRLGVQTGDRTVIESGVSRGTRVVVRDAVLLQ